MSISDESLGHGVFLLRGHYPGYGDKQLFGSPYRWVATVIINEYTANIKGMLSIDDFTTTDMKDIKEWLMMKGVERCEWDRARSGELIKHTARR